MLILPIKHFYGLWRDQEIGPCIFVLVLLLSLFLSFPKNHLQILWKYINSQRF
jgi:hypothetical protein